MKKYLGLFFVFTIALTLNANIARAEEQKTLEEMRTDVLQKKGEMENRIEAMRKEGKEGMESLRANIKLEKDTVKARIKETRISGRENALERFDRAVLRISDLTDRVSAQIVKLEAKGVDVADAKNFVATAESKLDDAKIKIAEINALLAVSINELSAENKTKLRTLAQDTQNLIVEAHLALKEAVKSLKEEVRIKKEAETNS